jgi:hypothetical protein
MARGWGKSEEDLDAEKEQAKEQAREPGAGRRERAAEAARRRGLELSLARVEDLLGRTENPDRRHALETARAELLERLERLPAPEHEPAR